jgi:uncharacterized surface protein with fasciclin (FAS1) repeats
MRPARLFPVLALSLAAVAGPPALADESAPPSIPQLATAAGRFDTLLAAVGAADLGGALASPGPFTVFAPTDDAFARLGDDAIAGLLEPAAKPTLARILKHHVVPGRFTAGDLVGLDSIETLAGTTLDLGALRGRLLVGDAAVETADLAASNGVIHVIDRVLIPPRQIDPLETLLDNAVQRGARRFNDGDPGACADIYATALDSVALGSGFGLDDATRERLRNRLAEIADMNGDRDRAWAYRRIIDTLYAGIQNGSISSASASASATTTTTTVAARAERHAFAPSGTMLFAFDGDDAAKGWRTVLDGVMGGRSTGRIAAADGTLVFDGATSLENNGGFSSMRCDLAEGACDGTDAFRLIVKGDGRDYKLGVKGYRGMSPEGYWKSFPTVAGEWTEVVMPIRDLERQFMGRPLEGRIAPEDIRAIEFYIYDKNAGPFRLEIDSIEAVRLDQTFDA